MDALYTAWLYLSDRHTVLRSHFNLLDESGPQLQMQRLRLFQLPFAYTDLA